MKEKRNTLQKGIVFDIFNSMANHPSAGMVYDAVHEKYPGISRATVYRLLAEAADDGRIQRVKLAGENDRYDFTLRRHYHIVCKECGAVSDVPVPDLTEILEKHIGSPVAGYDLTVHVLCENCKE